MSQVLRVREYERIHQGASFDAANRTVTASQHRTLERLDESYRRLRGIRIFQHGPRGSLLAQNFVGVIQLGAHQIEILPKIEGDQATVRHSLSQMIARAHGLDLHEGQTGAMAAHDASVLDIMIRLFCRQLWTQVRAGLLRRYQRHEANLPALRGRLDITMQLRRNLARQDRLYCAYDEFTEDNAINRVLKAALRTVMPLTRDAATAAQVTELLFCFADVGDAQPSRIEWRQLTVDRLGERYRPLLTLARLFLEGRSPDVLAGAGEGFALLFDMNELFEAYVGHELRGALRQRRLTVGLQGPQRALAHSLTGGGTFQLRPDIVVGQGQRHLCVLDTKWKRLREDAHKEGVTSSDAYQMFAYAERYDVPLVVLLYPHHCGLGAWQPTRARYSFGKSTREPSRLLAVASVDLSSLASVRPNLLRTLDSLGSFQREETAWRA